MVRWRCTPVVTASSNAPAMPLRPSPRMASIISCRCMETSQAVVAGAVGDRRVHQRQILERDDRRPVGAARAVATGC